jgi:hypothetical protein
MADLNDERDTHEKKGSSGSGWCFMEIRVKGQLSDQWSDWFENLDLKLLGNGEMILSGAIPDQAALMGILNKLNRLNLTLLSVNGVSQNQKQHLKGDRMDNLQTLNHRLEAIAWGAFFVWWGVTELFPSLPEGIGAVGIGLILLGLNSARLLNGISISGFTTTLGVVGLVLGGFELTRPLFHLTFELPVFAIFLIVLGMIFLARELTGRRSQSE